MLPRETSHCLHLLQAPELPPGLMEPVVLSIHFCKASLLPNLPEVWPLPMLGSAARNLWAHRVLGHGLDWTHFQKVSS